MICEKCQIEDEYIEEGWLRKAVVKFCPLHAAAPELLSCLKLARSMLVARGNLAIGDLNEFEAAIAKAEGKLVFGMDDKGNCRVCGEHVETMLHHLHLTDKTAEGKSPA